MNRKNFKNIKEIPKDKLNEIYKFCFTYTVQPTLKVEYINAKGIKTNRYFKTLPFRVQKDFLKKGIDALKSAAYYFEQHNDGRYHLHAFCEDTAINVLHYMKDRYIDTKMSQKTDIQDYCLLVEIVSLPPNWVAYCQKHQLEKDIFISEIEKYLTDKLDYGIVKIETNFQIPEDYTIHSQACRQFEKYLFGKKKFLVEI